MYSDKQICILLEAVISYKHNLRYYKYLDAWKNFEEIFEIMDIDNFDLNLYFQPITALSTNIPVMNNNLSYNNIDDDIMPMVGPRKMTTESFNSELLEEIKNLGAKTNPNAKATGHQNYL